ncbi:MAG: TatD family hydrolase [Clostridia bacterium]|nr:TatD family hydrolase [Clostridia bacterium]
MNDIFDTHSHYDDKAFDTDRDSVLSGLTEKGVCAVVNQGTDLNTSKFSLKLAEKYPHVYAAVGLHPECLDENSLSDIEEIKKLAAHPKAVAIGEIGLDYYYDIPKELQKQVFIRQLKLANELSMPVNIHDREAHGDTLEILKKYCPKGILHCFSGSVEMAREIIKLGMYIGIGGVVTFKNARKTVEVCENIPLDRIVLETDCPYLAPVPLRGKRNDSSLIAHTAQRIAEIKGITVEQVLIATKHNAESVYNVSVETEGCI